MRQKNNKKSAEGTRERLVQSMVDLMWTKGYSAVSVDDICKAAGAQKGSFYHFFPSKAELLAAVFESEWDTCKAELDETFSPTRPALQRFSHFLKELREEQEEKLEEFGFVVGCPFCTVGSELAAQDESVRERIAIMFDAFLRYFENAIRDAVADGSLPKDTDVKAKAQEVDALITGAITTARIKNSLEPVGEGLVKAVMHCLGAPA